MNYDFVCDQCGFKRLTINAWPVHCLCGKVQQEKGVKRRVAADTRGHDKAAICRSNQCGRYDAATDTCGVLTDRGKRGAIDWLYHNPDAKCVHPEDPQF